MVAMVAIAGCGGASEPVAVTEPPSRVSVVAAAVPELVRVAEVDEPVDATSRPSDPAVYVVARMGQVLRLVGDALDERPVLDISELTEGGGERGLLGLAFSPDGSTAYLNYTDRAGDTIVASIGVDLSGTFDRASLRTLLTIDQPYRNHNGGDLVVEPSGTVLVATGDGGSADDPLRVALDESSLLGKVLRLDPFTGEVVQLAKGLRNPWRIDLHDDRLWLADVGQNRWEEVSVLNGVSTVTESVDFGWSAWEADERFNEDQASSAHVPPVVAYRHGDDGCSISGGAVATTGALGGQYVFADYCSGRIWSIAADDPSPAMVQRFAGVDAPVAVVRAHGDLYVLSLSGSVWRIIG
jgi:glucose/arabinose dehydrogenase